MPECKGTGYTFTFASNQIKCVTTVSWRLVNPFSIIDEFDDWVEFEKRRLFKVKSREFSREPYSGLFDVFSKHGNDLFSEYVVSV